TLRPTATLAYPGGSVYGMSFTLDSERLVTWGGDSTNGSSGQMVQAVNMVVWDLAAGQPIGLPFGLPVPVGGGILTGGPTVGVRREYRGPLTASSAQLPAPVPVGAAAGALQPRQPSQPVHLPDIPADFVNVSADRRSVLIDGPQGITVVDASQGSTRLLPGVH